MEQQNKIEAVIERDIDLLLLEEFNVSESFCQWFLSTIRSPKFGFESLGAWHSVTEPSLGECDLVVLFKASNSKLALLIENKIDAVVQPQQGHRYKLRGELGIKNGFWTEFITCMVAPQLYLDKEPDAAVYDSNVSYEQIAQWFISEYTSDKRYQYKSYILNEAVAQNRRGYTVKPDERVTEFWSKYWLLASNKFPELELKKPGIKPANSDWLYFRPSVFDKRFSIVHKLERGDVDLQIAGAAERLEELETLLDGYEVGVAKAGKSAAVRLQVNSIDRFAPFESQQQVVENGLNAAIKLIEIGKLLSKKVFVPH